MSDLSIAFEVDGRVVKLIAPEYNLLAVLVAEPDLWHPTVELPSRLTAREPAGWGVVAREVLHLRRKLGKGYTHRGLGYRLSKERG